jgi:hypothetical protein
VPEPFGTGQWAEWVDATRVTTARRRAVVLVWRRPWMTIALDTYAASLLELLGFDHVDVGGPDRYPESTLDQLAALRPEVILLPSEPYAFTDKHRVEVEAGAGVEGGLPTTDLTTKGIRTPAAVARLLRC